MREVISIHVGQAGVQIGNACCTFALFPSRCGYTCLILTVRVGELYTVEHGLSVSIIHSLS
jgi:tubulin alpha